MAKALKLFAPLILGACGFSEGTLPTSEYFPADISEMFGPARVPNNLGTTTQNPRPPASYAEQWYTTSGGCSYSRAQAPGYPVTWHLILNPHHIGQPNAHSGCPVQI